MISGILTILVAHRFRIGDEIEVGGYAGKGGGP